MSTRLFRLSALICMAVAALSALSVCATLSRPTSEPVRVSIAPVRADAGYTALGYAITFQGDADGLTTLSLPDHWGGASELWRSIRDLTAEGGALTMGPAPNSATLTHAPGARMHMIERQVGRRIYWRSCEPNRQRIALAKLSDDPFVGHVAFNRYIQGSKFNAYPAASMAKSCRRDGTIALIEAVQGGAIFCEHEL